MCPPAARRWSSSRRWCPALTTLVDHSIERLEKGAAGQLIVDGPDNAEILEVVQPGTGGVGGPLIVPKPQP